MGARPLVARRVRPGEHRARRGGGERRPRPARRAREQRRGGHGLGRRRASTPTSTRSSAALDTNFFGAYRLTVALLPLLRASEHPRVVNVSSGMGGITEMGGWSPGYRVSKAALNAMTRILVHRAGGGRRARELGLPGLREHRHGHASSARRSRSRTAPPGSSGWPRCRTTARPAASSATASRSRSDGIRAHAAEPRASAALRPRLRRRPPRRALRSSTGRRVQRAQPQVLPGHALAHERGHAHRQRGGDLDRLEDDPVGEGVGLADAVGRQHRHAGGLEDAEVRRRGRQRRGDVDREQHRGGRADARPGGRARAPRAARSRRATGSPTR